MAAREIEAPLLVRDKLASLFLRPQYARTAGLLGTSPLSTRNTSQSDGKKPGSLYRLYL